MWFLHTDVTFGARCTFLMIFFHVVISSLHISQQGTDGRWNVKAQNSVASNQGDEIFAPGDWESKLNTKQGRSVSNKYSYSGNWVKMVCSYRRRRTPNMMGRWDWKIHGNNEVGRCSPALSHLLPDPRWWCSPKGNRPFTAQPFTPVRHMKTGEEGRQWE